MITIQQAITPQEKEAVYRFRYSVYVEEMGRYRVGADHAHKRLVDPEDDYSWNFYAHDGTEVVAANRVTWGGDGFSARQIEQYGLAPFLDELPARVLLVGERTMVAAAYRGTDIGAQLANGIPLPIAEDETLVVFGACEPHLISYYVQFGQVPYAARNMNSEESGYLIPLVTLPRGVEALNGLGPGAGLPGCIERVLNGSCAVASPAILGDDAYWHQLEAPLRTIQQSEMAAFTGFTDAEIRHCIVRSNVITCAVGDRVLKLGGTARNVFVVLEGMLEARDAAETVGALKPGDVFGETAFLLQQPRTLDVYVVEDGTRILSLSERVLRKILVDEPAIAVKLLANLSTMLCARAGSGARR